MAVTLKETWTDRFRNAPRRLEGERVLTAFNANIDVIRDADAIDLEGVDPVRHDSVDSVDQLRQLLKHAVETGESSEVGTTLSSPDLGPAEERIGGQAGIMASFLAGVGADPVFYTRMLSEELASRLPATAYTVTADSEGVRLARPGSCVNSDRTKHNLIFEFDGEQPGRLILSAAMDEFSPSFASGIERYLGQLEEMVDRMLLSGFHSIPRHAREQEFARAERQLERIGREKHLEYVYRDSEVAGWIAEHVLPHVDSIGLDEHELRMISELHDMRYHEKEEISLDDAFVFAKEIIDIFGLRRVHIHTYSFHATVTKRGYRVDQDAIRRAMVFAELAAIMTAEKGEIATSDDLHGFDLVHKHFEGFDALRVFGEQHGIEGFASHGFYKDTSCRMVAIPVLIHDQPRRLVGLGDIISSAAFVAEIHDAFR